MNSNDDQYDVDTVNEPVASCTRCFTVMSISSLNRWHDEVTEVLNNGSVICARRLQPVVCAVLKVMPMTIEPF